MCKSIHFLQRVLFFALFLTAILGPWRSVMALGSTAADFSSLPPIVSQTEPPMVLFGMSNDHQLYYKAYTDYDDLDGDDTVDTTYLHSFNYYGYFDGTKCYDYDNGRFEPKANANAENYCVGSNSNYWSGNFLNWASMARIDTVRKLLYGGYRKVDTATETVLERTYLPNDAHSFAKFYDGSDVGNLTPFSSSELSSGLTMCNTTVSSTSYSQDVTDAPLLRVAKGNFALWAANERWQCRWSNEKGASNGNVPNISGIEAGSSNPNRGDDGIGEKDYNARVQVCVTGLIGSENCKLYPNDNYKPIGLIQKYGDDQVVNFGLMTGSYGKNKSGGVLRKNIGSISDEINTTTDGTFKSAPTTGSIIDTLNRFRIFGYHHGEGLYNKSGPDGDDCEWGKSSFNDGQCSNWGNPVAEILSECYRYYGGKNAAFHVDDSSKIADLKTASWVDPLNNDNSCAKLNLIMLNASSISFDSDDLNGFDNDFQNANSQALTKNVGDGEGITNNSYLIGENGSDNNQLCTAKTVTNLGNVKGSCPDAPRLEGSYRAAGIAHYANTRDIRTDLAGDQNVTTYGVALSPAVPSLTIPVPGTEGNTVNILPACRNTDNDTNCAIVDFKISEAYHEDIAGEFIGTLYVNWEDSEQGGDYDQDMWGVIKYRITNRQITITTDVVDESTPFTMGFGYVISGTTDDGFHVHSGISGMTYLDCNNCQEGDPASSKTYLIGSSSASLLEQPLYYAAKWGGFTDLNGDGEPLSVAEWDSKNNSTGAAGADGIPDGYFFATNPSQLESQLKQVLDTIIARTASGTNAAVVSNSTTGVGAIYQALYQPKLTEGTDTVEWIGKLHGIFIDDRAHLREDANKNAKLDDYDTDKVIKIAYDASFRDTRFQRYTTEDGGITLQADGESQPLNDLLPIWSVVDQLATISNTGVRAQRTYNAKANNGRYIITAMNTTNNGVVNQHQVTDFTAAEMASENAQRYLDIESDKLTDLVNYIRGDDSVADSRNRTLDGKVWRLGDIIHSSPVMVSSPNAGYNLSHGDTEYGEFLDKYKDRRQMVYIGANDGMIHAFNAGYWDEINKKFNTVKSGTTEHALGTELWAYIPTNLLPHLQWLKDANYPHVYYMDGEGFAQDVKIFNESSATHKNGWGTILVMGMRFGGGTMALDSDGDGVDDKTTGSGYVIMDITDPEQAPVLLAEISASEFGFTTGKPAIVQNRPIGGTTNEWTLVFGSGPYGDSALVNGHSDQTARIIKVDLNTVYSNYENNESKNIYKTGFSPTDSIAVASKSLIGDITVTDWDSDLVDDAIYFGTSSLNTGEVEGRLMRVATTATTAASVKTLVNTEKPIMHAPLTGIDTTSESHRWIMAGTGRFLTKADATNDEQQWFIGVKEPKAPSGYAYTASVDFDDLVNTTDVQVFSDGSILENGSEYKLDGVTINNFDEMKTGTAYDPDAGMLGHVGWRVEFENPTGDAPTGRSVGPGVANPIDHGMFIFTEYVPPAEVCEVNGNSFLWALSFETGTSTYYAPIGQNTGTIIGGELQEDKILSFSKISLGGGINGGGGETGNGEGDGTGMVSGATFHVGTDGLKLIVGDSTGGISTLKINSEEVTGSQGRQSWRQIDTSTIN